MPTTPNYSFPFPSLSDVPNVPADMEALAEAVDTELARADFGWIRYASQSSSGSGWLRAVETSSFGGPNIEYVATPGEMRLQPGVYWLSAMVGGGTGGNWVRAWIRDAGATVVNIRGALVGQTAAGAGSAATGIAVITAETIIGLYQESNGAVTWSPDSTMLSVYRIGNQA